MHDWVEYESMQYASYCYACRHLAKNTMLKDEMDGGKAFTNVRFTKWNDMKAFLLSMPTMPVTKDSQIRNGVLGQLVFDI